ncbi:MAG: hypothetical protein JW876_08535 [Candidatus Krumholzibacteriota bacterium]|nr:hypothetical protein [Candidatus Krumholzibacteriota bacterium]
MSMALYGKILRIFDETTLLAGIGERDGLKRGDRVAVVERGEEIVEPETGESLGMLETIKVELVAVDVQERMSVLCTTVSVSGRETMPLSERMVRDSMPGDARERMNVASGAKAGLPSVSVVRAGDLLRVVDTVNGR